MDDAKVAELRKGVRHQLQQAGVQTVLHQLILEYQRTGEVVTPDDALDILQVRDAHCRAICEVHPCGEA